ncbi:MAG: tetratricopeptide repeat protein, partial [Rhodospirillales bacterium]|nr:tetratricopeptide repeat protein [Rhodospirillales bacterium]
AAAATFAPLVATRSALSETQLRRGDYRAAAATLAPLPGTDTCPLRLKTAWAAHEAGDTKTALAAFAEAGRLACQPASEPVLGQGLALLALGRLDEADFQIQAAARDQGNARARVARGAVAFQRKDYAGAIRLYESQRGLLPTGEVVWSWGSNALNNLGWSYFHTGDYAAAETVFATLARYNGATRYAAPLAGQGWAALKLGRTAEARQHFEASLRLAPGYEVAASGLKTLGAASGS